MADARLDIDPDITRAWTPPAAFYTSEEFYARQLEQVFNPAWHALQPSGPLAAGHARVVELLAGSLDESLLHARTLQGAEVLLSNVCTHRGHQVCEAPGDVEHLQCRYHGRRFGMGGELIAAPGFEGAQAFPSASDDLPRLSLEALGGLNFASLNPETPFAQWIEGVEFLKPLLSREQTLFEDGRRSFEIEAHWALYVDNFLEGFHIPFVHSELAGALDAQGYHTSLLPHGVLQIAEAAAGELAFEEHEVPGDEERRIAAYYLWLLPGTMLNIYPWGTSLNLIEPLGPRRTRVRFVPLVARPELLGVGAGGALELVEEQDERVVESVARGLQSRLYGRGRYAPQHERGVHHFHRLLSERLDRGLPSERL